MTAQITKTQPVKILEVTRLKSSTNGNPRYEIIVDDTEGWAFMGKTQSDNSLNYDIGNPGFRVGDWVVLGLTRAGRISRCTPAGQAMLGRHA